jgi:hypothetical protein
MASGAARVRAARDSAAEKEPVPAVGAQEEDWERELVGAESVAAARDQPRTRSRCDGMPVRQT